MSFISPWTISSNYDGMSHPHRTQTRCCFSFPAVLWFDVLPDWLLALPGAPRQSSALPGLSLVLTATLQACRNSLLGSDTPLKLTHLGLHSASSQTLLATSSDKNTFCRCSAIGGIWGSNHWLTGSTTHRYMCRPILNQVSDLLNVRRNLLPYVRELQSTSNRSPTMCSFMILYYKECNNRMVGPLFCLASGRVRCRCSPTTGQVPWLD